MPDEFHYLSLFKPKNNRNVKTQSIPPLCWPDVKKAFEWPFNPEQLIAAVYKLKDFSDSVDPRNLWPNESKSNRRHMYKHTLNLLHAVEQTQYWFKINHNTFLEADEFLLEKGMDAGEDNKDADSIRHNKNINPTNNTKLYDEYDTKALCVIGVLKGNLKYLLDTFNIDKNKITNIRDNHFVKYEQIVYDFIRKQIPLNKNEPKEIELNVIDIILDKENHLSNRHEEKHILKFM